MTSKRIKAQGLNLLPKKLYQRDRQVSFIGGEGMVKGSSFEGGNWKYLIEMPQGKEPTFGRAGAETMVFLNERELRAA